MAMPKDVGPSRKQVTELTAKNQGHAKEKAKSLDQRLLELADQGLSGQEIGEEMNIPPAEAMVRIRRILEDRDWLTLLERQKLNILQLHKIKSRLFEQVDKSFIDPDMVREFLKATEILDALLERASNINEDQLAVVSDAQARALVKLFNLAWDKAIERLQEQYPDAELDEITDVFYDGLREGVREITEED